MVLSLFLEVKIAFRRSLTYLLGRAVVLQRMMILERMMKVMAVN
jgi:hypothetical protein